MSQLDLLSLQVYKQDFVSRSALISSFRKETLLTYHHSWEFQPDQQICVFWHHIQPARLWFDLLD